MATFAVKAPFKRGGKFYQPGDPERGTIELEEGEVRDLGPAFANTHLGPLNRIEHQKAIRGQLEKQIAQAKLQRQSAEEAVATIEAEGKATVQQLRDRLDQAKDNLAHAESIIEERKQALAAFQEKVAGAGEASKDGAPSEASTEAQRMAAAEDDAKKASGGTHVENSGIAAAAAEKLKAAGLATVAAVRKATDQELRQAKLTAAEVKQVREVIPAEEGGKG